jgi:hypothetical protein
MQRYTRSLGPSLLFVFVYATLSFLFSLLSWGRVEGVPAVPKIGLWTVLDIILHPMAGALAALPSRRPTLIMAGALGAIFLDVDHLGLRLGLPIPGRASHALAFMALGAVAMGLFSHYRLLGQAGPPLLWGAVATASFLSHIAVDALFPNAHVPLWAPLVATPVQLSPLVGVAYQLAAMAIVWIAYRWYSAKGTSDSRRLKAPQ